MSGRVFSITPDIRNLALNAFLDLYDDLSKTCRLVYPPKSVFCPNCIYSPVTHKSSNIYRTGGIAPFGQGQMCPECSGAGSIQQEYTEDIQLTITEDAKYFVNIGINKLNIPDGVIQTKGVIQDLPKVLRCAHMLKNIAVDNVLHQAYRAWGEPQMPSNIIPNVFFIMYWQRLNV